jgi:tellurium resistance protein TerZ
VTVSLSKGQKISLAKPGGLTMVRMGLGWDPVKKTGFFSRGPAAIDLDASCVLFSGTRKVDTVWFRQLKSLDGSIVHSGDNRSGEGEGDDETIMVDLTRLPADVDGLAFTVNSFTGQTFDQVDNTRCRLVDEAAGTELCSFTLADKGAHSGVLMGVMKKEGSDWSFRAVGDIGQGQTVDALIPLATKHL